MKRFFLLVSLLALGCSAESEGTDSAQSGADGATATTSSSGTNDGSSGAVDGQVDSGPGTDGGVSGQDGAQGVDGKSDVFKCVDDADCEGQICDCLGRCVPQGVANLPNCVENINCGSGHYCDQCAGVCRKLKGLCEPCQDSQECDGGACFDFVSGGRYCLLDCLEDFGCPKSYACTEISGAEYKQCKPLSGLCDAPELCSVDTDCPYGEVCNDGKCGPGCDDDGECSAGLVCSVFRCVPACGSDNPCPEGQICTEGGHCKIEGGCLEPKDCVAPETYCDVKSNMCTPGCLEDYDCKASAMMCNAGKCVPKGCTANYVCAFGQVCDLGSGKCEDAPGPHCEAGCDPQAETACGGADNKCIELQDKDGNSSGTFCFVACGADPMNPCPQGYQCEQLSDESGNVQANLCMRDCTVNPI